MASTPDAAHVRGGGTGERMPEGATPPPLSSNNTHQLDFYQAMVDFRVMFPNMDEEIIEAVLRANSGAVDATIDQLLTMNVDTAPTDPPPPPPQSTPASHMEPPTYATVNKTTTPASWSIQVELLAANLLSLSFARKKSKKTTALLVSFTSPVNSKYQRSNSFDVSDRSK